MTYQTITTPKGETLVILPLEEFEALRDAADHAKTMAALAHGNEERLTPEETAALVAAETPLAFWRRKRGLTQVELANAVGMSQSALAGIESGARVGRPAVLKRLAAALALSVDDLIPPGALLIGGKK